MSIASEQRQRELAARVAELEARVAELEKKQPLRLPVRDTNEKAAKVPSL